MSVYTEPEEAIRRAVLSILRQTFTDFELILVNDNPESEETRNILKNLSTEDSRIRVITNEKNSGLGYALNVAAKEARADLVARMDTEDVSDPDRLEKQVAYMRAHADVDLLFTQWIDVDEEGEETHRLPTKKDVRNIKKTFFTKSLLMHPTLVARTEVLRHNPYPEMARPEDIVLWLRLMRAGHTFDILEEPLYRYCADRIDIHKRHAKTKAGSRNLLPHLAREMRHYWYNIYFWLYFFRTIGEYLASRNRFIFKVVYTSAIRLWKRVFGA